MSITIENQLREPVDIEVVGRLIAPGERSMASLGGCQGPTCARLSTAEPRGAIRADDIVRLSTRDGRKVSDNISLPTRVSEYTQRCFVINVSPYDPNALDLFGCAKPGEVPPMMDSDAVMAEKPLPCCTRTQMWLFTALAIIALIFVYRMRRGEPPSKW